MFFNRLSQTKKLYFIFETFIIALTIITIFLMQNIYDTSILVKEDDINRVKHLQILLLILFIGNYIANASSKYEMSGFNGNKFYGNCLIIPGFLIECYNLSEIFQMNMSDIPLPILTLSILVFLAVDFTIEVNIYKKFHKNKKKKIIINEAEQELI